MDAEVEVGLGLEGGVGGPVVPLVVGIEVVRADVGRVAEDADKLFALGIAEEIEVERTWWAMRGIDFDRHAIRQARGKGTIAAGRVERAAAIAAQGEHALDDLGRGEDLALGSDIVLHGDEGVSATDSLLSCIHVFTALFQISYYIFLAHI